MGVPPGLTEAPDVHKWVNRSIKEREVGVKKSENKQDVIGWAGPKTTWQVIRSVALILNLSWFINFILNENKKKKLVLNVKDVESYAIKCPPTTCSRVPLTWQPLQTTKRCSDLLGYQYCQTEFPQKGILALFKGSWSSGSALQWELAPGSSFCTATGFIQPNLATFIKLRLRVDPIMQGKSITFNSEQGQYMRGQSEQAIVSKSAN